MLCLFLLATLASGQDLTVATAPPVVVKTTPEAGSENVDPAIKEIKVTFSKEMKDGSWSWATATANTFPTIEGKLRLESDKKTAVLPVKLQPGKDYAIWVNTEKFRNFKDADGQPSVPYLLVFRTK